MCQCNIQQYLVKSPRFSRCLLLQQEKSYSERHGPTELVLNFQWNIYPHSSRRKCQLESPLVPHDPSASFDASWRMRAGISNHASLFNAGVYFDGCLSPPLFCVSLLDLLCPKSSHAHDLPGQWWSDSAKNLGHIYCVSE